VSETVFEPVDGSLVYDTNKGVVAQVMEVEDMQVVVRRPGGGVEWWADKLDLRHPTPREELGVRVAKINRAIQASATP
jgi:hypothetical protein